MSHPPEDMLDLSARARRGEASDEDHKRLSQALSSSAILQIAHRVGADFDAELAVKANDAQLLDEIVAGALAKAPGAHQRTFSRPRLTAWLAAAVALLVSVGALGWWQTRRAPPAARVDSPATPASVSKASPARPAPVANELDAQVPPQTAEQAPVAPPPAKRSLGDAPPSAQALFAKANRARSSRRSQEAIELYRLLQATHPSSAEALTSRVALGRLLLASADYAGALVEFDRQQSAGGALAEEALLWKARTLQKMGNSAAEQQAWRALLQRFPGTAYEREARARLQAGAPTPHD